MTKSQAMAEIFVTAFRSVSKEERRSILGKIFADSELRRDMIDMMVAHERCKESPIPYKTVRKELKKAGRL